MPAVADPTETDFLNEIGSGLFATSQDPMGADEPDAQETETPAVDTVTETETPAPAAPETPEAEQDDEPQDPPRPGIKQVRVYAKNENDLEVLQMVKGGLTIAEAQAVVAELGLQLAGDAVLEQRDAFAALNKGRTILDADDHARQIRHLVLFDVATREGFERPQGALDVFQVFAHQLLPFDAGSITPGIQSPRDLIPAACMGGCCEPT